MSKDAYAGTAYAVSDRGWMTEKVFLNWFQHQFIDRVKLIEGPKILIYDGHISHVSISLIDCAVKNDTTLLKLPPHTTHFLQPLDVSGFEPVKTKWDKVLVEWQRHNYGRTLGKSDFSKLLCEAWPALSEQNISAAQLYRFCPTRVGLAYERRAHCAHCRAVHVRCSGGRRTVLRIDRWTEKNHSWTV